MKTEIDLIRDSVLKVINDNPTTITIKKTTYSVVDGAEAKATTTLDPIVVRIYRKGFDMPTLLAEVAGVELKEEAHFITSYDALIDNPDNKTTMSFTVDGVLYKIKTVIDAKILGNTINKRAILEVVR